MLEEQKEGEKKIPHFPSAGFTFLLSATRKIIFVPYFSFFEARERARDAEHTKFEHFPLSLSLSLSLSCSHRGILSVYPGGR